MFKFQFFSQFMEIYIRYLLLIHQLQQLIKNPWQLQDKNSYEDHNFIVKTWSIMKSRRNFDKCKLPKKPILKELLVHGRYSTGA